MRDLKPEIVTPTKPTKLDPQITPEIEFKNVSFSYPNTQTPVLENVSFLIKPGTKLAIVGINGAGKTTLVKLLCRFYDPTAGQILVNGIDLRQLDLASWYHHLGVLFQDYAHYHLKVGRSIALGRSKQKMTQSQIEQAAAKAGANEFIQRWPKKYRQQLGVYFKGGVEASIGQWQKLALARVFYRDPSIFVLDEPTASLDAQAEAQVFEQLESLSGNKSAILISHRFSTVRKAQQIIVVENGTISESGTHAELMHHNGTYAHLFSLQAKDYQ